MNSCAICRDLKTDALADLLKRHEMARAALSVSEPVEENTTQSETSELSQLSSSLGAWADDPEVLEKVE